MRNILFTLLLGLFTFSLQGQQTARLAAQYYESGEFEKAAAIFKNLMKKDNRSHYYFDKYVDCLLQLEDYTTAEKLVKDKVKKEPDNIAMYVKQGKILYAQGKVDQAEQIYKEGIKRMQPDRLAVIKLANEFTKMGEYQLAIHCYEEGTKMLRDDYVFAYNLGNLYRHMGDKEQMVFHFLRALDKKAARIDNVQLLFNRYLQTEEEWNLLRNSLLKKIQDDPSNLMFTEMLGWYYIQQKQYDQALRQQKALDARLRESGTRIMDLAGVAYNAKDYPTTIEALEYIIDTKGETNTYYLIAYKRLLQTKKKQITEGFDYDNSDLEALKSQYIDFLQNRKSDPNSAAVVLDYARLQAYFLDDIDGAIQTLKEIKDVPEIKPNTLAQIKIELADCYLIKGERWESTLLYSQVDKQFRDDFLGELARFKNAKLSYYMGDFTWAQSQFNVLKSSTSKLISNDALDLSVFITDNLGLDTTTVPMEAYAKTELLIFQNKFDEAKELLKEMAAKFWDHQLTDDILFAHAQIHQKKGEYEEAMSFYERIIEEFSEDIRADNALFAMAELYEKHLGDEEKAKTLYEKLFIEMSGSTLAVEARKRFRKLRGDV